MIPAAIPTTYAGTAFRSRGEARWSVFFDCAGIPHHYEPDAYGLKGGAYLPDFWLPGFGLYFEVKAGMPSDDERRKCRQLADLSERDVLMAVGPPEERFNILQFQPNNPDADADGELFVFARDRIVEAGFWLVGDHDHEAWLGPLAMSASNRFGPMFSGSVEASYARARSIKFNRGEGRYREMPIPDEDPERHWREAA